MKVKTLLGGLSLTLLWVIGVLPAVASPIDYAALYARLSPAVVTITTAGAGGSDAGTGSGFLIKDDLVVTAAHVVSGSENVQVAFADGTRSAATLLTAVDSADVALLRLAQPKANAVLVRMGDAASMRTGSPVFVIGAPYGIEQTLSVGIMSGRVHKGQMTDGTPVEFLHTDAAINPGNSGGPMFNARGEVVGVVSFILSKSGGFDGIGFASAINAAYQALLSSAAYVAGFEGVPLNAVQSQALNVPADGILVQRVVAGSLAAELGLQAGRIAAQIGGQAIVLGGDVILALNCASCTDSGLPPMAMLAAKLRHEASLSVQVFRDRQVMTLQKPALATRLPELASLVW